MKKINFPALANSFSNLNISSFYFKKTTILDRYLLLQFVGPFLLAVGGFVIIGMMDLLFTLIDLFVKSGVPFLVVMRLLVYHIPAIMVLFFPMAVLFAVMLLLVRMAKDNEITVLRSSGITAGRILAPLLIISIMTSFLSYFTNEKLVPWASHVSQNLIRRVIQTTAPPTVAENVFFKEAGRYFYINSVDRKNSLMRDIMIYEVTSSFPQTITAKQAVWNKKMWTLFSGHIAVFDEDGIPETTSSFSQMDIHVDQEIESFYTQQKTAREMDSRELKEQMTVLSKGGVNILELKVEYYLKQSIPMVCFVFGLIGIALCLSFVRSGKDWWGVIFAVCVAVVVVGFFFFNIAFFRSMGGSGKILPLIGAWIPNMAFGFVAGGIIFYQCYYR